MQQFFPLTQPYFWFASPTAVASLAAGSRKDDTTNVSSRMGVLNQRNLQNVHPWGLHR
jgi:hypothetical protein